MGILARGAGRVIGIDKDEEAIARVAQRTAEYRGCMQIVHDDYKNIKEILRELEIDGIDGALLDLGVSSYQIDTAERGFSYSKDAPLDMRMDQTKPFSAYDVVNGYDRKELERILREYGEERFAARIAERIVREREIEQINSTLRLAAIVKEAIPAPARRAGGNPAKRTFQAIRIEVNGELSELSRAVADFIDVLNPGGRLCIITFHSLEDRIVKTAMKTAQDPCTCPKDFPICVCGKKPLGKMEPKKPILPTEEEIEKNPRSKSAKLRIFWKA